MITLDYFYKQRTLRGFGLKNFNWFTTLFTLVKLYFRITPFSIFFYLMELIRPRVSSRIVKFKRRKFIYGTYGLYIIRSFKHACRFFYRGAATRFDLETPLRLFCEIIAIFSGKSKTLEQRQEAHLSAFQSVWRTKKKKKDFRSRILWHFVLAKYYVSVKPYWFSIAQRKWKRFKIWTKKPLKEHWADADYRAIRTLGFHRHIVDKSFTLMRKWLVAWDEGLPTIRSLPESVSYVKYTTSLLRWKAGMRTIAHIEKDFSNTRNFLSLKEFFTIKAVRKSYELLQKIKQFLSKTSQLWYENTTFAVPWNEQIKHIASHVAFFTCLRLSMVQRQPWIEKILCNPTLESSYIPFLLNKKKRKRTQFMSFFNSISYKIQNVDIFALRRSYTISEEAHYYNLYKKKFKVYMPRRRFIDHNRIRRALIGLPSVHKGLRKGIKTWRVRKFRPRLHKRYFYRNPRKNVQFIKKFGRTRGFWRNAFRYHPVSFVYPDERGLKHINFAEQMAEKYRFLFGADYVYRQRWYRRVVLLEKQYWLAKKLREISEIQRRSNQKTNVALIRKNEMPGRKRWKKGIDLKRKEEKFLVGEDKENKILVKKDSKSEGKVLVENQTGVKSIETLRAKIISNAHKRKKPPRNKGKANRWKRALYYKTFYNKSMPVSSIQKIPDNNKDKNKKRFNDIDEKNKRVFNQGVKKNSAKPYFNKFADRKGGGKPNAKKFADKAKDGGGILYTEEEAKKGSQRRIDFWSTKVPDTVEGIKRKYGHLHFKKKKS